MMANKSPNITGISKAAKAKTEQKIQAVEDAIKRLNKARLPINISRVAGEANVSTNFIYKKPELRDKIERLRKTKQGIRAVPDKPESDTVVSALRLKIRNMEEQHKNEIQTLRQELAEANKRIERLTAEIINRS